jgi:hypothetical protein
MKNVYMKNVHNMKNNDEIYMKDNDLDGNQKDIFQILMAILYPTNSQITLNRKFVIF